MAEAVDAGYVLHSLVRHGALRKRDVRACGGAGQHHVGVIAEQTIEAGWSHNQRHLRCPSEQRALQRTVRHIDKLPGKETPFGKRLAFPGERAFILGAALQIFEDEARHEPMRPGPQVGDRRLTIQVAAGVKATARRAFHLRDGRSAVQLGRFPIPADLVVRSRLPKTICAKLRLPQTLVKCSDRRAVPRGAGLPCN